MGTPSAEKKLEKAPEKKKAVGKEGKAVAAEGEGMKLRKRTGPEAKRAEGIQSATEETKEAILAALIPMPALGLHDSVVQQRKRHIREHEAADPEKHARLKAKVASHSAPSHFALIVPCRLSLTPFRQVTLTSRRVWSS